MKKTYLVLTMILMMCLAFAGTPVWAEGSIDAAYEIGMVYFNIGDMNGAINQLSTVSESSPQYVQAQSAIIQAKAKLRDQQMVIVDVYLSAGDYQAAIEKLETVIVNMPGDSVVLAKYEEAMALMAAEKRNEKSNMLAQAEEALIQKDFASAMKILEEALKAMPDDAELNAAYIRANMQYKKETILRIDELLSEKKFAEAETLSAKALQVFPNDEELRSRAYRLLVAGAVEYATTLEAQGDLESAIVYLNAEGDNILKTPEVSELMKRICSTYRQNIVDEADFAFETEGYLSAVRIIQKGQSVLMGDSQLDELLKMYKGMAPVSLLDEYDYFENKWSYLRNNGKDNLGNIYDKVITPDSSYSNTYMSFYVAGEYEKLTGTVFLRYKSRSTERKQKLKIYGDDLLLYESSEFTAGVLPEHFEINITGVKNLRFETSGSYGLIEIGDIYVNKNTKLVKQKTSSQAAVYEVVGFQEMKIGIEIDDMGKIKRAQVLEHHEVPGFGADLIADTRIFDNLIGQDIREAQIDVKAGVTMTSNAINAALDLAAEGRNR